MGTLKKMKRNGQRESLKSVHNMLSNFGTVKHVQDMTVGQQLEEAKRDAEEKYIRDMKAQEKREAGNHVR